MTTYIEFRCYASADNMRKDKRLTAPYCNKWYGEDGDRLVKWYAMGLCQGLGINYKRPVVQVFDVTEDEDGKIINEKLLRTQY